MALRWGASLSVKLILTTTMLIVVTVVGSGVLNVQNVRREIDEATRREIEVFRMGREVNGEFGTPLFARAVEPALIDKGDDLSIVALTRATVAGDTKQAVGAAPAPASLEPHGSSASPGAAEAAPPRAERGPGPEAASEAALGASSSSRTSDPTGPPASGAARRTADFGLRFALVLDHKRDVVSFCHEDPKLRCSEVASTHPPMGPEQGVVAVQAWQQALAAWEAAAAVRGPGLVKFDLTADGAHYRVFALPVVAGAPSTAEAALAVDPGPRQGYVVLGYDLAPIAGFVRDATEEKSAATTRTVLYSGAVGGLFVLIGTLLAILHGLSIARPIKLLAWRADQIARGDLDARVEVTSRDEIGVLGEHFNFMADQIAILLDHAAERARIEQELAVVQAIQETLVPSSEEVERGCLSFAGYYQPAAQTGGDWWTWHELVDGKILLLVGDVTGHGVASAMITAAAKAACDVARHVHEDDVTLTRLLDIMNHAILASGQRRFVMTCFASVIDTRERTITYANAGHQFPYVMRASDAKAELGSLVARGNPLGDDRDSRYEAKTTALVPGDVLVWYTDGIVECENAEGEPFGDKRFRAALRSVAGLSAAEMRDALVNAAFGHFTDTPRKDDITLIAARIA